MEPVESKRDALAELPTLGLLVFRCLLLFLLTGIFLVQLQTLRSSSRFITAGELRKIGEKASSKADGQRIYWEAAQRALAVEVQNTVDVTGSVEVEGKSLGGEPISVTVDDTVTVDGDVNCN